MVTGRKEDVAKAKREILSAAEHFTLIRATRRTNDGISACVAGLGGGGGLGAGGGHLVSFNKNSLSSATPLPGQITIQVRVPYRVVGLVVGPKGNTIKHIQHETQTYIVTPSRDKQPIFEVTGMPDNVEMARKQIEAHIATRTGNTLNNSLAIPAPPPPPPPPPAPAGTLNQLSDTIASTQASLQSLNALNQILNDDLHSEILSSIYKNGIGSALEYSQIGANVTNTTNNRCHNSNPFNCGFVGEINPTVLSVNDIQRRILNAGKSNVNMQLNCTDFINNLIDSNAVSQFASESNTNFPQLAHNTNTIRNLKSVINTINLLENSSNGDTGTLQQQNCPTTNALLTRSCSSASSTASSSKSFNNGNNPQYWKSVNSSTIPANKACGNGVVSGNDSLDIDEGIGDSPLYSWGLPNALAALTNSYCSPASTSISPTDSLFGEHHVNSKNAVIQNQQYIGSAKAKLLEKLKRSNCWMCQDKDIVAVLLPCGHKMFCMECANRLCQQNEASCPVCSTQVKYYQSVRIHN